MRKGKAAKRRKLRKEKNLKRQETNEKEKERL